MKKYVSIFFSFLLMLLMVVGCSCDKDKDDDKASLGIGDMNATSYVELASLDALKTKVENEDSFVLYVYMIGCEHCRNFKPILDHVIDERNLIVYGIEFSHIVNYDELSRVDGTPSLVVYDEGEILTITDPDRNSTYFKNYDGLKLFFDKYTYSPVAFYITLDQLRAKKANNENFIVYFSRATCSDCNYLNEHYMRDFYEVYHSNKEFYILECDAEGVRLNNSVYDEIQWQAIKDEFGLSEEGSATFGYGKGVVPTFQYYNNGRLTDMMVYANDEGDWNTLDDGTVTITITGSYYWDNPFMGETIVYVDYHDTVEDFYNLKLQSFLSQYLKFVD